MLDRPNPLGGYTEGNVLDPAYSSFIGLTEVPIRHGMTIGELARFYNGHYGLGCDLTIVPMSGWTRDMYYDDTGLPFVANRRFTCDWANDCFRYTGENKGYGAGGANASDISGGGRIANNAIQPYILNGNREPTIRERAVGQAESPASAAESAVESVPLSFRNTGGL